MSDMLKYGLIAVGGYLLYEYFYGATTTNVVGASTTTSNTPAPANTATTPQAGDATATSQSATMNLLVNTLKANGVDPTSLQTTDIWNYYYAMVRGIPGPAPEVLWPGVDRGMKRSLAEWWVGMTGAGFSGLGMIAHFVNPYRNIQGTEFGDNLAPTGMEKYIKRFY